ncbi:cation:proton antiporter regulatory subunit [Nocardia donostiensis]|uniref:Potassium transporter TrkA n=1 Tax=Nocardia donostiensis TaxID=1538463 RepID=A0A1V2THA0_9NOCA|nr:TrkA C-terminal domain-containing protein [Nocardia donostiensis]ONM48885.1 potassium transporter TrkA [Nocardia donostiensis]OQS22860.1 potassium transporter TrkA [Nocardia donostiensis]
MNVDVTPLPGIGVRKDFPLAGVRRRIGVIDHKDGTIDLIFTKVGDPDTTTQIPLTEAEAGVLANLLGAPQLVAQLRAEHRDMEGVNTRQLAIRQASPYDGRTLGETQMRTRTKTSIVAVMRAGQVHPSPGPEFAFTAGDLLVVVGTGEGLDAAADILTNG